MVHAELFTDGGSRGNPGDAGLGFVLQGNDFTVQGGWFLPHATNNIAEYSALVWGLRNALEQHVSEIKIYADSELMVKQITGTYKVKNEGLRPLFQQARELLGQFVSASIEHVYREQNKEADALANAAMDEKGPVGNYLIPWDDQPTTLFDDREKDSSPLCNEQGNAMSLGHNPRYTGPGALSGKSYENKSGTYELTVREHFDSAHALKGYPGACQYLHGHTWDIEVTIAGTQLDTVGILYDFKDIKRDVKNILENFDHRCINDIPPFDTLNPTAEHMARVIFYELEDALPSSIELKEIAVWESPAARVTYRPFRENG